MALGSGCFRGFSRGDLAAFWGVGLEGLRHFWRVGFGFQG